MVGLPQHSTVVGLDLNSPVVSLPQHSQVAGSSQQPSDRSTSTQHGCRFRTQQPVGRIMSLLHRLERANAKKIRLLLLLPLLLLPLLRWSVVRRRTPQCRRQGSVPLAGQPSPSHRPVLLPDRPAQTTELPEALHDLTTRLLGDGSVIDQAPQHNGAAQTTSYRPASGHGAALPSSQARLSSCVVASVSFAIIDSQIRFSRCLIPNNLKEAFESLQAF